MKIESSYKPTTPPVASRTTPQHAAVASAQDEVSLSHLAGAMQSAEKPPVNSARIQEIKQAISEGRFKVNPEAIADRLIETARDLLNSNSKREA
ncbi:MAG: flagellar biosynthesis anti-sigma factor FlgM [Azonexus sp.]